MKVALQKCRAIFFAKKFTNYFAVIKNIITLALTNNKTNNIMETLLFFLSDLSQLNHAKEVIENSDFYAEYNDEWCAFAFECSCGGDAGLLEEQLEILFVKNGIDGHYELA